MNRQERGFSLIECLIYCTVMSLLALLVFEFFLKNSLTARQFTKQGKQVMSTHAAHAFLANDIQCAACHKSSWDVSDPHAFVCRVGQAAVGWHVKDGSLYRTSGQYDFAFGYWVHKSRSLVAERTQFAYQVYQNAQTITGMDTQLQADRAHSKRTTYLTNKVIDG